MNNEALRLADALERGTYLLYIERDNTATELRRLHDGNQELLEALKDLLDKNFDKEAAEENAKAAIAKATGESE